MVGLFQHLLTILIGLKIRESDICVNLKHSELQYAICWTNLSQVEEGRFCEHYRKIKKKPKKINTFLYQHFKRTCTGHSPDNVLVQSVKN